MSERPKDAPELWRDMATAPKTGEVIVLALGNRDVPAGILRHYEDQFPNGQWRTAPASWSAESRWIETAAADGIELVAQPGWVTWRDAKPSPVKPTDAVQPLGWAPIEALAEHVDRLRARQEAPARAAAELARIRAELAAVEEADAAPDPELERLRRWHRALGGGE